MTSPIDWDPVARDENGSPLSAGELCQRETCWHRWLDHDHCYAEPGSEESGWCIVEIAGKRCGCTEFQPGPEAVVPPSPFAEPPPEPPPPPGAVEVAAKHAAQEAPVAEESPS